MPGSPGRGVPIWAPRLFLGGFTLPDAYVPPLWQRASHCTLRPEAELGPSKFRTCLPSLPSTPAGLTSGTPSCPLSKHRDDCQQFPYQAVVEALLWKVLPGLRQDSHTRYALSGPQGPFHPSPDPDLGI